MSPLAAARNRKIMRLWLQLAFLSCAGAGILQRHTLPPTDDPPQPRCPAWADGLMAPPAAIDPRVTKVLPSSVPQDSTNASSDDGLAWGATPSVFVFGDSLYTMGVAVQQATGMVFAAEYSSFNLHSFNASATLAMGRRRTISPKSEFYGFGGIFAVLAPADGSLYLAYDGNGCMAGNPASVGAACAFVRHVELGPTGAERIAVHNLTSPKQMALDIQGRLHISEEWPEQVTRWDPRTGEQTVVLRNTEYAASGPIEGIAINSAGDIYFSEYGMFGNQAFVADGAVSGVPIKSGAVWVKRAATGAVEMVARGFWRTRGLALDEKRGFLYVANEANAWDQVGIRKHGTRLLHRHLPRQARDESARNARNTIASLSHLHRGPAGACRRLSSRAAA